MRRGHGDRELVRLIRGGDEAAAQELFSRHLRQAWAAAYAVSHCHHVADDALQDGVERAILRLDSFDEERPFAPWFTRIVVNRTLEIVKRRRVRDEQPLEALPDIGVQRDGRTVALGWALQQLSPEQRATVVMRLVLGLGAEEVAEATGTATGTVHSRLSRALGELRGLLSGER